MEKRYTGAFSFEELMSVYIGLINLIECGEYAVKSGELSREEMIDSRKRLREARMALKKVTAMMDGVTDGGFSKQMREEK